MISLYRSWNNQVHVEQVISTIRVHKNKSEGHYYDQWRLYIPSTLSKDNDFPFRPGQKVLIKMDKERLIIEKAPEESEEGK